MTIIKIVLLSLFFSMELLSETIDIDELKQKYQSLSDITATKELTQHINIGFSNTTGNTNNLDLNTKYDLSSTLSTYKGKDLKLAFDGSYFLSKKDSIKSDEEYLANLGLEQDLGKAWLSYFSLNWLRNPEFKNYNHKVSIGAGFGRAIVLDETQTLTLKMGTSFNSENYANNQKNTYFNSLNEYLKYNNKLNTISNVYLKTGALQNFQNFNDDYEILALMGVVFHVGEKIDLSIEEEIAYDNLPPIGFKKTDTKSIVRLGYQF